MLTRRTWICAAICCRRFTSRYGAASRVLTDDALCRRGFIASRTTSGHRTSCGSSGLERRSIGCLRPICCIDQDSPSLPGKDRRGLVFDRRHLDPRGLRNAAGTETQQGSCQEGTQAGVVVGHRQGVNGTIDTERRANDGIASESQYALDTVSRCARETSRYRVPPAGTSVCSSEVRRARISFSRLLRGRV